MTSPGLEPITATGISQFAAMCHFFRKLDDVTHKIAESPAKIVLAHTVTAALLIALREGCCAIEEPRVTITVDEIETIH